MGGNICLCGYVCLCVLVCENIYVHVWRCVFLLVYIHMSIGMIFAYMNVCRVYTLVCVHPD